MDPQTIWRLYGEVLQEDTLRHRLSHESIRTAIQNMRNVYLPNPDSLFSSDLALANYDDPAHRCAYLHKYAPLHTDLTQSIFERFLLEDGSAIVNEIMSRGHLKICSIGGGPGCDVLGVLAVLAEHFEEFQASVSILDIMVCWKQTFESLLQVLQYGNYGYLSEAVDQRCLDWEFLGVNLVNCITNDARDAMGTADIITMVKFVSAAACTNTASMLEGIFSSLRPGALVLYIDNSGGGFHSKVLSVARRNGMVSVYGPLKHQLHRNTAFDIKRYGYTPCLETRITAEIWMKTQNMNHSITIQIHRDPLPPRGRGRGRNVNRGHRRQRGQRWQQLQNVNVEQPERVVVGVVSNEDPAKRKRKILIVVVAVFIGVVILSMALKYFGFTDQGKQE